VSGNPFDEEDADRTVIRPVPGGRRAAAAAAAPPPPAPPEGADTLEAGDTPLLAAAGPLLQLLAHLRSTANPPDAAQLRARAVEELRRFEQRGRALEVPMEQLRPAHYVLCASLDDVVLDTPWGASGAWAQAPLAQSFHQEARGGARFFTLLDQLRRKPDQAPPLLELMYLCLSLGFMGRFRSVLRGQAEIERVRGEVHAAIAAAHPKPPSLSPAWQGLDAPIRRRGVRVPVWVMASVAVSAVGLLWMLTANRINDASDALMAAALAAPPASMPALARPAPPPPPPPPPLEPGPLDRLRRALAPEIADHAVSVLGTDATPVLRVPGALLFAGVNARVLPQGEKLLARVAAVLQAEPGRIEVLGYTDSEKVHTVAFPSNFQLSAARAQAVRAALAHALPAARLTAEGRADADPVAPNSSAEGRAQNRRVEIVLHRPDA
jgi:type VI secretion system protein ImpK